MVAIFKERLRLHRLRPFYDHRLQHFRSPENHYSLLICIINHKLAIFNILFFQLLDIHNKYINHKLLLKFKIVKLLFSLEFHLEKP